MLQLASISRLYQTCSPQFDVLRAELHALPQALQRSGEHHHRLPLDAGMLAYMKRTTVKLPDDLDAKLRHEAHAQGKTISQLTREAIEAHLGHNTGSRRRLMAAGVGRSGQADISERIEEILGAEVSR